MTRYVRLLLLVVVAGLCVAPAFGAKKDRPEDKKKRAASEAAGKAGSQSACLIGQAAALLDINNVRAPVYNTGSLFYPDIGLVQYEVPKGSGINAVYATNIWIGGMAGNELRMTAADYAQGGENYEFWPGPLDAAGSPPSDCSAYDRIWKINRTDIEAYERTGQATTDLAQWPWQLGAPVVDGDGIAGNYDLAAGDRPEMLGDQMLWWIMNDAGGAHLTTLAPAVGLEVHATAFAFQTADALNNTTFFKFKIHYKPADGATLNDAWIGIWADTDLGQYGDDFVGVDTTLGLGFSYNGDNFDENGGGVNGYLNRPAAVGYDFFQGPLVDSNGDGVLDPETDDRLKATRFVYYNNTTGIATGEPADAADRYGYLRGRWTDGQPMTEGGNGYGGSVPVNYMFSGEPPGYWSEDNTDGRGTRNTPADRRMIMSTGPFTMQPGDVQEIVFGVVWAQTADRIGSLKKLKKDDILAQGAFDFNFALPRPPDAPIVSAAELDGSVVLSWGYEPNQNNYLNSYDAPSAFLVDTEAEDQTYTFEGYKVFQYPGPDTPPEEGTLIATFDVVNDVLAIVDSDIDPATGAAIQRVVAAGTDSGVRNHLVVERDVFADRQLRNYTEYYFGVQAYAYNPNSDPKIYQSPVTRITATPSSIRQRDGGTVAATDAIGEVIVGARAEGGGGGVLSARVVDPLQVTGHDYEARVYEVSDTSDPEHPQTFTTYDLVDATTGEVKLDGRAYFARTGEVLPLADDLLVADGLSFTVSGPEPGPLVADGDFMFVEVQGPGGTDPCGAGAVSTFGCAEVGGNWVYGSLNSDGSYTMFHEGDGPEFSVGPYAPNDFEIRFTEAGGYAVYAFANDEEVGNHIRVPFEVWDVGPVGPFGTNDPSDDVRLIPALFSDGEGDGRFAYGQYDNNGPATDRVYAYYATTSYAEWEAVVKPQVDAAAGGVWNDTEGAQWDLVSGDRPLQRIVFIELAGDESAEHPGTGTIVRLYTTKPLLPGDRYVLATADYAAERGVEEVARTALDDIGIVPNPYRARSEYDVSTVQSRARIINLPAQATIRIYALNGTLLRTLFKGNPDEDYVSWDLRTEEGLPVASGLYLVHVTAPGLGERVLKFGVVQKRIQLDVF